MIHIPFKTINENLFYERAKGAYKAINPVRLKGKEVKSVISGCYFPRNNSDPSKDLLLRMASKIPETTDEDSNILLVNDMGLQWVKYLYEKYNIKKFTILCVSNGYASEKAIKNILTHDVTRLWDMGDIEVTPVYFDEVKDKMFDLVIANPPYGMKNVLAKPIIKNLIPLCKEFICLAPAQAYSEVVSNIRLFEEAPPEAFEEANMQNLFIASLSSQTHNSFEGIEEVLLKEDPNYDLINTFNKYSKFKLNMGTISLASKKLNMDESRLFMITKWTPLDGVHLDEKSKDIQHNRFKKPIDWDCAAVTKAAIDKYIYFNSQLEFDNFCYWWYSNPKTGFTDLILKLIFKSSSMQVDMYKKLLPNINWSKNILYTDDYVLNQMGLKWNENRDGVEKI